MAGPVGGDILKIPRRHSTGEAPIPGMFPRFDATAPFGTERVIVMPRIRIGFLVALGLLAFGSTGKAQFNNLPPGFGANSFDPFSAYYGYYLPRNQSIAAQLAGGSTESINLYSQARRENAQMNRVGQDRFSEGDPYRFVPIEERPYTRQPTILLPGQRAGPSPGGYFGRSQRYFYGARSGAPGEVGGGQARMPQARGGRGMGGMGGRMGGMGGMGGGMGGFGGGFR